MFNAKIKYKKKDKNCSTQEVLKVKEQELNLRLIKTQINLHKIFIKSTNL